jgi:hypothetical protein
MACNGGATKDFSKEKYVGLIAFRMKTVNHSSHGNRGNHSNHSNNSNQRKHNNQGKHSNYDNRIKHGIQINSDNQAAWSHTTQSVRTQKRTQVHQ